MKKLLLSLMCLMGIITLQAETFVMSEQAPFSAGTTISGIEAWTNGDYTFTPVKGATSSTAPAYNKAGDVRLYAANTFTIDCAAGNMTEISFTISSQGKKRMTTVEASTGSMTVTGADDYTCKWVGDAASVTFTVGDKATLGTDGETKAGQLCFTQIDITGAGGGSTTPTVAAPSFTPNGGEVVAGTEVTIACNTEGATIYYTLDGTEPSTASSVYSAPVAITASCTLKAIATYEGMDNSVVTSADFTVIEAAQFGYVKTITSGKNYLIFSSDKVAVPLTGTYGYIQVEAATDENGYISANKANGFTITEVEGGYTIQDSNGKYVYQTGTYNSFNVSETMPETGAVWTIVPQADGTMLITNVATGKFIQYDTSYTSYGCYSDARGVLPCVYEEGATAQEKPEAPLEEVATIAEWVEKASTANVKVTGTATVMYQNGRYLYIQDASSALLVYGDLTNKYSNGDQISNYVGAYKNYNDLVELIPVDSTFTTGIAGTAIEPTQVQIEDVATDMMSQWVKISGVEVVAAVDTAGVAIANTYTITDNTGSLTLYNQFNNASYYDVVEMVTGTGLTVEGFISVRNGVAQIIPSRVYDPTGVEAIELNENTPAVYYNLQGVKVTNPANGVYIKVQGNKASKIYVK